MPIKLGASSYSYQDEYQLGLMSLEDCMASLAACGGTGFEIIPEQMLPGSNFINLSQEFTERWFALLDKYGLEPTCADIFDDYNLYKNRTLSENEQLMQIRHYLTVAKKLGFSVVRVLCLTPYSVLEKAIPMAEDLDIKLGLEIHAPLSLHSDWAYKWREIIAKTGTKHGGFVPDFGIFTLRPLSFLVEEAIRDGANPEICDFIIEEYKKNAVRRAESDEILQNAAPENTLGGGAAGWEELAEKVKKMGGKEPEMRLVTARNSYDNPKWMLEISDQIVHVHAKFFEMVPDGQGGYTDPNIDTETAVKVLRDSGYDGYISSEYEAYHFLRAEGLQKYPDGPEQVRRHHVMMRKVLNDPFVGKLERYGR